MAQMIVRHVGGDPETTADDRARQTPSRRDEAIDERVIDARRAHPDGAAR